MTSLEKILTGIIVLVGVFILGIVAGFVIKSGIEAKAQLRMEQVAAEAISKITVENKTVQGKATTIIKEVPIYQDCKQTDEMMTLINGAFK